MVRRLNENKKNQSGSKRRSLYTDHLKHKSSLKRGMREGFENECFVAYYKGNLFYTGELDFGFQEAISKLMKDDKMALKSVSDYLHSGGFEDFDPDDPIEVAELLNHDMYWNTIDGQDYWNFDEFEIFPEYELDESLTVNERHEFRHNLSNDPTDYERYVNYAETLVIVCENLTEAAERCLRRIEDNEEFYNDPKNERWYGFDEKMDQISKVMRQIESLTNKIDNKM